MNNKKVIDSWSKYSNDEAEKFGEEGDLSRQFILNRIIFDLVGNFKGKNILDAGCGTGYLSRKFAKLGGLVTGVEPSEQMYQFCIEKEKKEKLGIKYIQEDLSELKGLENSFDIVISNMVFMDIPDYKSAIKNCISSLKSDGIFIFSISHPAFPGSGEDWKKDKYVKIENYFDPKPFEQRFGTSFGRPISEYINFVIENDCGLQKMIEPRLSKEILEKHQEDTRNYFVPQFLFLKFTKN